MEGKQVQTENGKALETMIQRMATGSLRLADCNAEQLSILERILTIDTLKNELRTAVELKKIPYADLKETFLSRAGKQSKHTFTAYSKALELLEAFATRKGIHVLELKYSEADSFIDSLDGSPSTVRLRAAAVSAFFTFLERETEGRIQNVFRGTKARPKAESKTPAIPSLDDIKTIMDALKPMYGACVVLMIEHGFRVGALPSLTIWGNRYSGKSKGKKIDGILSPTALEAIEAASLEKKQPFKELTEENIKDAFRYATAKLYKAGTIPEAYSVHDLRHFFAIEQYKANKDIFQLKELLNHSSIATTEKYLRGLKAYID